MTMSKTSDRRSDSGSMRGELAGALLMIAAFLLLALFG